MTAVRRAFPVLPGGSCSRGLAVVRWCRPTSAGSLGGRLSVLESASDIAEDVGVGEDLLVGVAKHFPHLVELVVSDFAYFESECLCLGG